MCLHVRRNTAAIVLDVNGDETIPALCRDDHFAVFVTGVPGISQQIDEYL